MDGMIATLTTNKNSFKKKKKKTLPITLYMPCTCYAASSIQECTLVQFFFSPNLAFVPLNFFTFLELFWVHVKKTCFGHVRLRYATRNMPQRKPLLTCGTWHVVTCPLVLVTCEVMGGAKTRQGEKQNRAKGRLREMFLQRTLGIKCINNYGQM